MDRLEVVVGDITRLALDAIVNAANERMLGGGGVDGAIHRAAGPELLTACRAIPEVRPGVRCPTGDARITPGFNLSARYVIHTVGPVWRGGQEGEPALLRACYRSSLKLAVDNGLHTIAFPAISTGVFSYPPRSAARVATDVCRAFLAENSGFERIVLVAFREADAAVLRAEAQSTA
ncbi:MAG: O-acetyl-ADP-ribose deacetylase [Polyangiaceae bacterium]|nr:O-acetyl-ADP-ribose deacetylase [Polyangiaceae bacterium]